MRVFIEGSVGAGKTFLATLLHNLFKLDYKEANVLVGSDGVVVNGDSVYDWSLPGDIVIDRWLKEKGIYSSNEDLDPDFKKVREDDLIILLVDSSENLEKKRLIRGRPYEFDPSITKEDLRDFDEYFYSEFRKYCRENNIRWFELSWKN